MRSNHFQKWKKKKKRGSGHQLKKFKWSNLDALADPQMSRSIARLSLVKCFEIDKHKKMWSDLNL